jgi:hypothetical protein
MKMVYRVRIIPLVLGALWLAGCGEESPRKLAIPEMRADVQYRNGKNVAELGLIFQPDEKYSLGPASELPERLGPGYWRSINDGIYEIRSRDPETQVSLAVIELQGDVRWDERGHIVEGKDSFQRIMTEIDLWRKITKRELLNDRLVLTDDTGKVHTILRIGPNWDFILDKEEDKKPVFIF